MKADSFTVLDLPVSERPRERMQVLGAQSLSLVELLALVLGKGIRGENVLLTSQKLLAHFGNLQRMSEASLEDLQAFSGIGLAKATQLKAMFELSRRLRAVAPVQRDIGKKIADVSDVVSIIRTEIGSAKKEHFLLLSFDTRLHYLGADIISIGIVNASIVHPRETFLEAIRRHATSVIIAHNHPSGDPEPSDEDISMTKNLVTAGEILKIHVIDHIIVTNNSYLSFKSRGYL